jgi:hypothetical protein
MMDLREPDLIKCRACGEYVKQPCFFILEIDGCDIRRRAIKSHLGDDDDDRRDELEQKIY